MRARVEAGLARHLAERVAQPVEGREVEAAVAPLQRADGVEGVRLEALDEIGVERLGGARDAEGAVVHMTAGAARDLADLARRQIAEGLPVELAHGGEGHVIDVEVQSHADGVGGDDEVDVARLVERDLRVAGSRRQRAEHHGRAAALASDELGDGIDLVGGEGDDGRALRAAA